MTCEVKDMSHMRWEVILTPFLKGPVFWGLLHYCINNNKHNECLKSSQYVSGTLLRILESMFHLILTERLLGSYYCYPHVTNEKNH